MSGAGKHQSHVRRLPGTTLRTAVASAASLALAFAVATSISGAASAATTLPALPAGFSAAATPASGVFTVTGRAWGHRIGMSQVGAQYAGRAGFTAPQILAHYYPGTVLRSVTSAQWAAFWPGTPAGAKRPVMRVKLEGNNSPALAVTPAVGLSLWTPTGGGKAAPLPTVTKAVARWRIAPVSTNVPKSGLRLQWLGTGARAVWTWIGPVLPLGSGFASGAGGHGVRIEQPNGTTRTEPSVVVETTASPASTTWTTVSLVDPQTYLASVVAAEIGPSSAPATLAAQAIAARTYSTRLAYVYGAKRNWDVCSITVCQYYPGMATGTVAAGPAKDRVRTFTSTTTASAATLDQVLLYRGSPALTMFAAADGGYTKSGNLPYLPAQADPWDTASRSSSSIWSATLPVSALAGLVPAGDRITAVALGGRDGLGDLGGTPSAVLIDSVSAAGEPHRTATTPGTLRALWSWPSAATGLRSNWFAIVSAAPAQASKPPVASTTPATPAPPAKAAPVPLRVGMTGRPVVRVQARLHVIQTGYFGPKTLAAVKRWQSAHRLRATGVVDVRTWASMGLAPR